MNKEIGKLMKIVFISLVSFNELKSSIFVVPKENDKICICKEFRKLNVTIKANSLILCYLVISILTI